MSVSNIHKAIYDVLDGTGNTVCSGLRTAATPTPCYVYEVSTMEMAVQMLGAGALNHWTVGVEVSCVADTVADVCALIDDLVAEFDAGPINYTGTLQCSIALASFQVAFSTATPDDGQQDAERVGIITLSLLIQED
jgi:hypothetical protein